MSVDPFAPEPLQKHKADLDISWDALHHTLGEGPTQAAPGNHKHPLTDLVTPTPGDGGGSIAGIAMEYSSGTTTEGETGYLGDVTITSHHDPTWVRLICGPDDPDDPLWSDGYITPSKDGIAHFAAYLNLYGNSGLPGDSYLRVRLTREPTVDFPYQDHTGYQDIEIREFMNILVPWMWMIQVQGGRQYSLWVRLRRENSTADSGTIAIGSRQFKMHNFLFSSIVTPPPFPVAKSLQDLILSYNPWAYFPLTVLGSPTTLIDDISINNRNGTRGGSTTGIVAYNVDKGQPNPELSVFNSGTTFGAGDRYFSVSSPLNFDTSSGYTILFWADFNGISGNQYMSPQFLFNSASEIVTIKPEIDGRIWRIKHNTVDVGAPGGILGSNTNSEMKLLCVTYDKASTTLKVYSQGELVFTNAAAAAPVGVASNNLMCLAPLGNANNTQHLAIYTRALTADQISTIWHTGDAMPTTASHYGGTFADGSWIELVKTNCSGDDWYFLGGGPLAVNSTYGFQYWTVSTGPPPSSTGPGGGGSLYDVGAVNLCGEMVSRDGTRSYLRVSTGDTMTHLKLGAETVALKWL